MLSVAEIYISYGKKEILDYYHHYRKPSGKAPAIHPGAEPPFLSRWRGGGMELAFDKQKEYTAVL